MKILFICKHNRFRSKVAEAIYNHHFKEGEVKSAGMKVDNPRVSEVVRKIMEELGYVIRDPDSKLIDNEMIGWADKIIIVADNVEMESFPKEKTEKWEVEDCSENDSETIKIRIKEIEERVKSIRLSL